MKKVLVVDDSAFMRKVITDWINLDEELKVVGTARNGKDAIQKIKQLSPDVVTMDVEMPIMNGLETLKWIMNNCPLPVVMLSSITKEGAEATIKALELGAVDFITKPTNIFKMNEEEIKQLVIEKVRIAANVTIRKNRIDEKKIPAYRTVRETSKTNELKVRSSCINKIVAIGTSTGGPKALQEVIPHLSKNIPASVVVVQHMPAGFTKSLAERLNNLSQINVKEAENNEILLPGYAYIAPGGYHLKVNKDKNKYVINLTKENPVSGHRPSVDAMLDSLAKCTTDNVIAVIMTGMGSDGADGMKKIKMQKGYTIAQDEESCVVYGMPKSAVNLGCIDEITPLQEIAKKINKILEV
ncbi:chemotaxis response regulator protein-glutamate methylesterase [Lutibacter sp. B2]|nr:chemotaxis response regulator protein-glutamate methylesterase [Lutibacter sp. B2]